MSSFNCFLKSRTPVLSNSIEFRLMEVNRDLVEKSGTGILIIGIIHLDKVLCGFQRELEANEAQ